MSEKINIEVAFATERKQKIIALQVDKTINIKEAIKISNIQNYFLEFDLLSLPFGVFSKIVKDDYLLQDKDRIEIYRPLIADPKDARRKRAEKLEKTNTNN